MALRTEMVGEVIVGECCSSVMSAPLDDNQASELALGFTALSDPVRLKLLSLLASAESGEVCVCDLVRPVGKSQGTVSHHLKILAGAGLVVGERRGKWVWYSVRPERLQALRSAIAPVA
jgi:ArsR family transcriptional regulator